MFPDYLFFVDATQQLKDKLTAWFPSHGIIDVIGVIYPQYWKDFETIEPRFRKHLDVIKDFCGQPKWVEEDDNKQFIPLLLDFFQLEL